MADVKISDMTPAASALATNRFEIEQANVTFSVTGQQIVDLVNSGFGFTQGSIAFGDATGGLTESPTNMTWDNTNKRLILGGDGTNAAITSQDCAVISGSGNTVSSQYAMQLSGTNCLANALNAVNVGGSGNTNSGATSVIAGATSSFQTGNIGFITAGTTLINAGLRCALVAGNVNSIAVTSIESAYIGGGLNNLSGDQCVGLGGKNNRVNGTKSVICGGDDNETATVALNSFIGGGTNNTVNGNQSVICGGNDNETSVAGINSFVGGGSGNTTSGEESACIGGELNIASGDSSSCIGGEQCHSAATNSYTFGRFVNVTHTGSMLFQLDDVTTTDFSSTATNTWCLKSLGGMGLQTNAPNSGVTFGEHWSVKRTASAVNTSTSTETIIGITDTSVARTVTLNTADAVDGRLYIINDESGGAGTNNITIDTEAGQTINGSPTKVINVDNGTLKVYSNGSNWFTY